MDQTVPERHSMFMGPPLVVRKVDNVHLDAPSSVRHLRIGQRIANEVDRTEMGQLPLLPAIRIRGPFQRDRESHCQDRIEAAKEVSLTISNKRLTWSARTAHKHFIERSGDCQP